MNIAIHTRSPLNDNIFNPANAKDDVLERFALLKQVLKGKGDAYKEFTSEAYVRNIMQAIEELKYKKVNRNFYKVKLDLIWHVIKNMDFYLRNFKRTRRFVFDVVTVW